LLHKLNRLLKGQDPEALRVLKTIGTVKGLEKQMEQVEMAIKKYDFEGAVEILEGIDLDRESSVTLQ
jgi:hypothetical protein